MRYIIYGYDLTHTTAPFVRNLNLTDETDANDILIIIAQYWNSANRFYYDQKRDGIEPTLILASDKNKGLTLFSQFSYNDNDENYIAPLRRIGVLLPESHPLFNFTLIYTRINRFVRSGPVSEVNFPYFLKQIEDFV